MGQRLHSAHEETGLNQVQLSCADYQLSTQVAVHMFLQTSHNLNHQLLLGYLQPETASRVCLARESPEIPIQIQWDLCAEAE